MEKILIIQTAFIGDAVLTLPMIQKLKEIFYGSELHVLCIPDTQEIFANSPSVDRTLVMDKKGKDRNFLSLLKFISKIRSEKYTRIYSPHRSFRSSILVRFSGVEHTYGFSNSSFKSAYRYLIRYESKIHEVQRNFDLIGFLYNAENWKILPEIKLTQTLLIPLEKIFVNYNTGSKFSVIAPGSIWNTKKYPLEYFSEVIKYFLKKDFYVLLLGGKNDRSLCEQIASGFDEKVVPAAGKFSLVESIEILRKSEMLVSNDSAPTHLGVCADIPVLTLYCSTVPDFGFYPYNSKSRYLSYNDLPCKPCGIHGYKKCPVKTFACGYNLKPAIVISKIEEMLND